MKLKNLPFHDRKIWTYYLLFFAGSLTLAYQALNFHTFGDSVDLICLFFLIGSLSIRRLAHVIENATLMTAGYILPLLIRNTMKLSYSEAPSGGYFIELALNSALVTFGFGFLFSALGWMLRRALYAFMQKRKAFQIAKSIQKRAEVSNDMKSRSSRSSSEEENTFL